MKKYLAEMVGTFILVLFGCGTAVVAGDKVGVVGIAIRVRFRPDCRRVRDRTDFRLPHQPRCEPGGLGCGSHEDRRDCRLLVAQCVGAIVAAGLLSIIAGGIGAGYDIARAGSVRTVGDRDTRASTAWMSAIVFEFIATLIFVIVILGSTQKAAPAGFAGLAIGITLVVIHIFGIRITGVSVNPARSLGPALLVGGKALAQVWLFLLIPSWPESWRDCSSGRKTLELTD